MKSSELELIHVINSQDHTKNFLSPKSLSTLKKEFNSDNLIYLSVLKNSDALTGYIVAKKEEKSPTVQLKRILIDEKHLGVGKKAISSFEAYCVENFSSTRVWLDVYEQNRKAINVYETLGYTKFKQGIENSKVVHYYEKTL